MARCLNDLNVMRADYNDVVPRRDFNALKDEHDALVQESNALRDQFNKLHTEHETLLEVHEEVSVT